MHFLACSLTLQDKRYPTPSSESYLPARRHLTGWLARSHSPHITDPWFMLLLLRLCSDALVAWRWFKCRPFRQVTSGRRGLASNPQEGRFCGQEASWHPPQARGISVVPERIFKLGLYWGLIGSMGSRYLTHITQSPYKIWNGAFKLSVSIRSAGKANLPQTGCCKAGVDTWRAWSWLSRHPAPCSPPAFWMSEETVYDSVTFTWSTLIDWFSTGVASSIKLTTFHETPRLCKKLPGCVEGAVCHALFYLLLSLGAA